jgi:hypothetical protein
LVRKWGIDGRDGLFLVGLLSVLQGVRLWSEAAAWVTAGVVLLAVWAQPYAPGWRKGKP